MTGRAELVRVARAWVGTPYVLGASLRGVGADCVGLVRGVLREGAGLETPAPPGWRRDWADVPGLPMIRAARAVLEEVAVGEAEPGDVVAFRDRSGRRVAHCAILAAPSRVIHAAVGVGVVEVELEAWRGRLAWAGRANRLSAM